MPRFYYGWTVAAAAMVVFTLVTGVSYASYGVYVLPISREFHLSRANANSGLILINLGAAVASPFLGRLLDGVPARRLMVLSSVLYAGGYAVIACSRSIWLSAAVLATIVPLAVQGAGTLTAPLLVARWFAVQRGRAMLISQLGLSLGGLLVPPVAALLVDSYGWRNALLAIGLGAGAALLLIALTIREWPGPHDQEIRQEIRSSARAAPAPAPTAEGRPLGVRAILGSGQFWTLTLGCALVIGLSTALQVSLVPIGRSHGLSMLQAASLLSVQAACGIAAKIGLSVVADRIDKVVLLSVLFVMGGALNALLLVSGAYGALVAVAGGFGLVSAAVTPLFYAVLAERFGPASFGAAVGLTVPLVAVSGMLMIRYAGEVFDHTGGYALVFVAFAGLQLVGAALVFSTRFLRSLGEAAATPG